MGIRGVQLNLFKNYLSNRMQRVKICNNIGDDLPINNGVPQGSVLGPTLFLAFINELCNLPLLNGKIVTFADDTALIFHGDSWEETYESAQRGLDIVNTWLTNNALTLNVDKTKYMLFSIKTHCPSHNLTLSAHICNSVRPCNCRKILATDNIKYLGVVVDSTLNFDSHIDLLCTRTRKLIYIFKNLRSHAEQPIIKMVYQSLCESVLTYCITVWGGACKTNLIKLERAQRAVLKVSHSKPFFYPTHDLYQLAGVLSVRQLFVLNTVLKQHSITSYNPSWHTKKRCKYETYRPNNQWTTAFSRKFFGFIGAYLYNKINKVINIYPLTKFECKRNTFKLLKDLDYNETEKLITVLS